MANPGVEITCYIPTTTRSGKKIDDAKVQEMINKIWPKYRGATQLRGTGYYSPNSGEDQMAECHVLSIVTEMSRSIKNDEGELAQLRNKIQEELNQEVVLITWRDVNVV